MNSITNKEFPIRKIWIIKTATLLFIVQIFNVPTFLFLPNRKISASYPVDFQERLLMCLIFFILITFYCLVSSYLIRKSIKYSFGKDSVLVTNGVFIKSKREIHYSDIVGVYIHRDVLDKLLGVSNLIFKKYKKIEKRGGDFAAYSQFGNNHHWNNKFLPGWSSWYNQVSIPGLSIIDAKTLEEIISQKMSTQKTAEVVPGQNFVATKV